MLHNVIKTIPHRLIGGAPFTQGSLSFVRIWNIILHQISAKISVFFRSKAEEKALTAVSEKASSKTLN